MKKLLLAVFALLIAVTVAVIVFAKLGFIDIPAQVLAMLEKAPATRSYVEVYRLGLEYQDGQLNLDETFSEQKAALKEIEAELAAKEDALIEQESQLAAKAKELELLASTVAKSQKDLELKEENLGNRGRMAKVYADMEPRAAASILLSLDSTESADLLKRMSDKDIAEILPAMPPEKAAELGRVIAGQ